MVRFTSPSGLMSDDFELQDDIEVARGGLDGAVVVDVVAQHRGRRLRVGDLLTGGDGGLAVVQCEDARAGEDFEITLRLECGDEHLQAVADGAVEAEARRLGRRRS
jgi:hypothetical protein